MKLALQQITEEPDCGHNQEKSEKERRAGCKKPSPGATAGGCAFDGAQIVLLPIADAAHIVHGPATCCGHSYNNRGTRSVHGDMHTYGFSTDVSEMDIVFGAEKKLKESIKYIAEKYMPKAVFVYQTCVTAMTGEDIEQVCSDMSEEVSLPVIPVDSPGFAGSKNLGNKLAGYAIAEKISGTKEPDTIPEYPINLIGEYNIAGELWQIEPVLKEVGISILSRMTGNASYDEICWSHRAKASVVICSRALMSIARQLDEKYSIPWLEGSFYGMKQTKDTLLGIAKIFEDVGLAGRIKRVTERLEQETMERLQPYLPKLKGKKVLVYTGGVKSWSVLYQLEELGMEVIKSSTRKSTDEDIERMLHIFKGDESALMPKGDGKTILSIMKEHDADLLLAGGRNMYTAMKGQVPFVDVNQERLFAYAGYDGMVELAKRLVYTMESPVFELAASKAPWEV
jgi:nitrogenase molybdenum-cofactor synthesis protein NifE